MAALTRQADARLAAAAMAVHLADMQVPDNDPVEARKRAAESFATLTNAIRPGTVDPVAGDTVDVPQDDTSMIARYYILFARDKLEAAGVRFG